MQPLENIRVLDITRALAGPYCTMMLGDLGAEVIKVEAPGSGDESRSWGPPFVGLPYAQYPGESAYFIASNRNKKSITINLKNPEGKTIIRKLVESSDVFVENFRTGVLDKMGLGYADLQKLNPRLVYCSISGYGRNGPYADRPGYDAILQAEGGLMSITGPVDGVPSRVGIPIIDITTGMFSATAILAALRARELNGEGQLIDMSLFDTHLALLSNVASNYLVGGSPPRRYGNAHPNLTPYEAFHARDRWLVLGAANDRQWEILCQVLGCSELIDDTRFKTNGARLANRESLLDIISKILVTRDADDWLQQFGKAGLPCGPINSIPEVFNDPHTQARDLIINIDHPTAGSLKLTGFPYKFSKTPAEVHLPPPLLGEHTSEILIDLLGYSLEEVAFLKTQGAI